MTCDSLLVLLPKSSVMSRAAPSVHSPPTTTVARAALYQVFPNAHDTPVLALCTRPAPCAGSTVTPATTARKVASVPLFAKT